MNRSPDVSSALWSAAGVMKKVTASDGGITSSNIIGEYMEEDRLQLRPESKHQDPAALLHRRSRERGIVGIA